MAYRPQTDQEHFVRRLLDVTEIHIVAVCVCSALHALLKTCAILEKGPRPSSISSTRVCFAKIQSHEGQNRDSEVKDTVGPGVSSMPLPCRASLCTTALHCQDRPVVGISSPTFLLPTTQLPA